MNENEIMVHLNANPDTLCYIGFGTCQIRLAKGEGAVLLRCIRAERTAIKGSGRPAYTGPTSVTSEFSETCGRTTILFQKGARN